MKANSLEELVTNSNIAGELRNYTDWHTRLVKFAQLVADWQKEQDTRETIMSDGSYFQKCYELGKKDMKEQMMRGAVECELYLDGDFLAIDLDMAALGYSEKDKIKVIVIKEGE